MLFISLENCLKTPGCFCQNLLFFYLSLFSPLHNPKNTKFTAKHMLHLLEIYAQSCLTEE